MNEQPTTSRGSSFIKLEGTRVNEGSVNINEIMDFLEGVEKATKYFIGTDYPGIAKTDYDVEVRIESGSIIVYLVGLAATGAVSVMSAFGISYAKKAGEQLAVNDIATKTSAQVIDRAMRKIKSTAKIAKHVGAMGKRNFPEANVENKNTVILPNEKGEKLNVSVEELDTYTRAPKDIFKKLTNVVDDNIELILGESSDIADSTGAVHIDSTVKTYFTSQDADDDGLIFPEWQHGEFITLRGVLCRANTNTGTLGFVYEGHTITSYLFQMEIQHIKDSLFDKEVEIEAIIIRSQKKLDAEDELKKPKLEIRKIVSLGSLAQKPKNTSLID